MRVRTALVRMRGARDSRNKRGRLEKGLTKRRKTLRQAKKSKRKKPPARYIVKL